MDKSRLPPWARPAQLRLASAFFEARVPHISVVLACYALPLCYAGRSTLRELQRTGQLRRAFLRRALDAAQMVGDLMAEGGLMPGPVGWDAALYEPLDEEDRAGALLCFSYVVLDGLKKLGVPASDAEAEAYLHAWSVVGHLMDIRSELLPRNFAEAEALWRALARRRFAPSSEGHELTAAIVEMMEDIVPGEPLDGLPSAMMRHLMGDALADTLGVPPADLPAHRASLTHAVARILEGSPLVAQIARRAARTYLEGWEPPKSSRRHVALCAPVSERAPESPPISA
jgi:hypothetical protein